MLVQTRNKNVFNCNVYIFMCVTIINMVIVWKRFEKPVIQINKWANKWKIK